MSRRYAEGLNSILDFYHPRSWLAVAGYFVFHFVAVIVVCAFIGKLVSIFLSGMEPAKMHHLGFLVGKVGPTIYAATLFAVIMRYRKTWTNIRYVIALAVIILLGLGNTLQLIPLPPDFLILIPAITLGLKVKRRFRKEEAL